MPLYLLFFSLEGSLVLLPPGSHLSVLMTLSVTSSLAWGALAYLGIGREERLRIWASQCQE